MTNFNLTRLMRILSLNRAFGSVGEDIAASMLNQYSPESLDDLAYIVRVGKSRTLFSAHLDTAENANDGDHKIIEQGNILKTDGQTILGADDGAGVCLLMEMIDYGVNGVYVFTRGEECGGVGARHVANNFDLTQFDRAVAFDRRGTSSVITHMSMPGRCCSDVFAGALCYALGMKHLPDNSGSYTDVADYAHIIPECTNVSVGYANEHRTCETLDVSYLCKLKTAVVNIDWEWTPTIRLPDTMDNDDFDRGYFGSYE